MKRIKLLIAFFALIATSANAQSTNQVIHTTGSMNVGGTNVSVTQSGCFDTLTTYCPSITSPYIVGYDAASSSYCNGAYIFQFSPPVDSLTLNFSGISNVQDHKEIITLDINGAHYPIPTVGSLNNCDSLAVLDPNGNIAGCTGCVESGWSGTTIYGPISELRVRDSVMLGLPGGSLFSLFISDVSTASLDENLKNNLQIFPNPFVGEFEINTESAGDISMYDVSGNQVLTSRISNGNNTIKTSNLAAGTYIVKFLSDGGSMEFQKLVKQSTN